MTEGEMEALVDAVLARFVARLEESVAPRLRESVAPDALRERYLAATARFREKEQEVAR